MASVYEIFDKFSHRSTIYLTFLIEIFSDGYFYKEDK